MREPNADALNAQPGALEDDGAGLWLFLTVRGEPMRLIARGDAGRGRIQLDGIEMGGREMGEDSFSIGAKGGFALDSDREGDVPWQDVGDVVAAEANEGVPISAGERV